MRTENKNIKQDPKYIIVYRAYMDQYTYKYIAIYKFKKDVYRFIYQAGFKDRKSGIYKLSDIGWVLIEVGDVIKYHENLNNDKIISANIPRSLNIRKTKEKETVYLTNEFFNACQRYIDFLIS